MMCYINSIFYNRYLRMTNSLLEVDFFNFDWYIRVYNEFKPEREYYRIQDISYGKENFAVSCVNSLDMNYPEYVEYSKTRIPKANVNINTGEITLIKPYIVLRGCDRGEDLKLCPSLHFLLTHLTDSSFLVCCDCEDDCKDKLNCACWQLTIQHTDAAPGMKGMTISSWDFSLYSTQVVE